MRIFYFKQPVKVIWPVVSFGAAGPYGGAHSPMKHYKRDFTLTFRNSVKFGLSHRKDEQHER